MQQLANALPLPAGISHVLARFVIRIHMVCRDLCERLLSKTIVKVARNSAECVVFAHFMMARFVRAVERH